MNSRLILVLMLALLWSCNSLDKPDPVASYIYIPSLQMQSKPGYGSIKQEFTQAWVYLDGTLQGAFPVPGLVPLIKSGSSQISVFAGIIKNGIKETPELFPLVDRFDINISLTPGKIDTIYPIFKYRDDVTPLLVEDFEGSTHLFTTKLNGKGVGFNTTDAFEGFKCGVMEIDTINPLNEVGSFELNDLPKDGTKIYVEINYKNEVDLLIGLKGYSSTDSGTQYLVGLRPSDEWRKVYIDLTDEVLASDFPNYKLLLEGGLPFDGTKFSKIKAQVLIDNIKLMY